MVTIVFVGIVSRTVTFTTGAAAVVAAAAAAVAFQFMFISVLRACIRLLVVG